MKPAAAESAKKVVRKAELLAHLHSGQLRNLAAPCRFMRCDEVCCLGSEDLTEGEIVLC